MEHFRYFVKLKKKKLWNKNNAMKFLHEGKRVYKYFRFLSYLSTF